MYTLAPGESGEMPVLVLRVRKCKHNCLESREITSPRPVCNWCIAFNCMQGFVVSAAGCLANVKPSSASLLTQTLSAGGTLLHRTDKAIILPQQKHWHGSGQLLEARRCGQLRRDRLPPLPPGDPGIRWAGMQAHMGWMEEAISLQGVLYPRLSPIFFPRPSPCLPLAT